MALETLIAFGIIAGIILIGFLGELIFKRYRIPSVLLLLATGYILGPITGVVNVEMMLGIEYIFAPLALIILLFDGGIQLNIYRLAHESGRGILLGVIGLILAICIVAGVWVALGHGWLTGIILGAIVAGTGSAIVIPIARGMDVSEKARQTITIESSLTDVVSVVLVLSLIGALVSGHASVEGTTQSIIASFSIGAILGGVFGMAWIGLSTKLRKLKFYYMLTLAIMLVLYIITEASMGSGAIAALVFGVMLGNMGEIGKMLKFKDIVHEPRVAQFQDEISFLVRTFFFVFLGIIVSITDTNMVIIGVGITILLFLVRIAAVRLATYKSDLSQYKNQLAVLMPRGLATAIMATYPAAIMIENSGLINSSTFGPLYREVASFPQIAFVVIITSIIITTIGVMLAGKRVQEPESNEPEGGSELSEAVKREAAEKRRLHDEVEAKRKEKVEIQKTVGEKTDENSK